MFFLRKKKGKDDPLVINDLPNDMIDTITSFLLLIDIIHLQIVCKLFHGVCKTNTHELIGNVLYIKYLHHYQTAQPKEFKLKHIKKICLAITDIKTAKLFIPFIQYHTNLIHFLLGVHLKNQRDLISTFCSNIPNNITINILCMGSYFYDCLIPKADGFAQLQNLTMTVKQMNLFNSSHIRRIEFYHCEYNGDINKINLQNWKSLQQCMIGFDERKYGEFIFQSVLLQPPNLSVFRSDWTFVMNPFLPTKLSKNVKILIFHNFQSVLKT